MSNKEMKKKKNEAMMFLVTARLFEKFKNYLNFFE